MKKASSLVVALAICGGLLLTACSGGGGGGVSTGGGSAPAWTPKTGQTTSYAAGDDGALRKGVAWPTPRFTVASSGTGTVVTDNLTGLTWQQDGSTPTVGLCTGGTTSWQGALDYAACLNTNNYLGHNDWRLPNVNELQSLVSYGQPDPAAWLDAQGFTSTQSSQYWSSTTFANLSYAWYVEFYSGNVSSWSKPSPYSVRCVRGQSGGVGVSVISLPKTGQTTSYAAGDDGALQKGVAWPTPRFTVASSGTGTVVTDNLAGLTWQQDGSTPTVGLCTGGTTTWQGALDYAACLNTNNYLGHNDWRLPNANELRILVNYGQSSPAAWLNSQGFANMQGVYWLSTTPAPITAYAVYMNLSDGHTGSINKTSTEYVLCVRGGQ